MPRFNLIPQVQRVSGVGDAQVFAGSYAMRIWLDPEKMASYGLVPSDVSGVLAEQNIEAAPGISVNAKTKLSNTPSAIEVVFRKSLNLRHRHQIQCQW